MADDANDQEAPAVPAQDADQPADKPELSLTDELSAARESEPETPAGDSDQPVDPEDKPKDDAETPTDPAQDQPADQPNQDDQPADRPDVKAMSKEERREFFLNLRQQQQAHDQKEVAQRVNEHYQPQSVDALKQQYIDQGYDDFQSEMLADRDRNQQAAQIAEARTQIVELNATMNQQALQVLHDFPVFDPDSPDYDQQFAAKARELYVQAASPLTDDRSGVVVKTNVLPYDFYKQLHDLRDAGLSQAQIKAQQNAERQLASVQPSGSSAPAPVVSAEDSQASRLESAFKNVV